MMLETENKRRKEQQKQKVKKRYMLDSQQSRQRPLRFCCSVKGKSAHTPKVEYAQTRQCAFRKNQKLFD